MLETTTITDEEESLSDQINNVKIPKLGQCGKTTTHQRIVGGSPSKLHSWPWIAALGFEVESDPVI